MKTACSVRVRGVVQGVGFRPFVFRLACVADLFFIANDDGVRCPSFVEGG
jgi:hydrogenase maturation factor HypF (carbamoyltransferase family)